MFLNKNILLSTVLISSLGVSLNANEARASETNEVKDYSVLNEAAKRSGYFLGAGGSYSARAYRAYAEFGQIWLFDEHLENFGLKYALVGGTSIYPNYLKEVTVKEAKTLEKVTKFAPYGGVSFDILINYKLNNFDIGIDVGIEPAIEYKDSIKFSAKTWVGVYFYLYAAHFINLKGEYDFLNEYYDTITPAITYGYKF